MNLRRVKQLKKLLLKELLIFRQTDAAFQNTVPEIAAPDVADKPETAQRVENVADKPEMAHHLKPTPRVENLEQLLDLKIAADRKMFAALELKIERKIAEDRKRFETL